MVPEKPLEASWEIRGRKGDLLDEIGEGEEGVLADVLGVCVRQGPGGVEVVCEDLLGLFEGFGLVLGGDIGDYWQLCGGFGGSGEVARKEGEEGFGEGHCQGGFFFKGKFVIYHLWTQSN